MNTKAVKVTSLLMSLALVGFIGSVMYSLVPPQLAISPPESFSWGFDPANGTMYLSTNTTVTNNGFYPIDNLIVGLELVNSTGFLVVSSQTIPVNIPPGFSGLVQIHLPLNLTEILSSGAYHNMFVSDEMNLTLTLSAAYAFQIFRIRLGLTTPLPWIGPLANLTYNLVDTTVDFDDQIILGAVLEVSHEGWMTLNDIPVNVTGKLDNGTVIGSGLSLLTIAPGTHLNMVNITVKDGFEPLLLTENATINLEAALDLLGNQIGFSQPYSWGAPLYGLTFADPSFTVVDGTHSKMTTILNATNYSPLPFGINATISVEQSGSLLGSNETEGTFAVGVLTSLPIIVYVLTPSPGSVTVTVELKDPVSATVLEQTFTYT
ncbi:MAG: hypothetical protein ACTSYO_10250 [Candidatus Ranarchaeia archaeon]